MAEHAHPAVVALPLAGLHVLDVEAAGTAEHGRAAHGPPSKTSAPTGVGAGRLEHAAAE